LREIAIQCGKGRSILPSIGTRFAVIAVQVHEFVDSVSISEEAQDARQQLGQVYRPY